MFGEHVTESGISTEGITSQTQETLEEAAGENLEDFIQDGLFTSSLLAGAFVAQATLSRHIPDRAEVRTLQEMAGGSVGSRINVETLLDLW
jgi:hypothetical protein